MRPTVQQSNKVIFKCTYIIYNYLIIKYIIYIWFYFSCWTVLETDRFLLDGVGRSKSTYFFLVGRCRKHNFSMGADNQCIIFFCWTCWTHPTTQPTMYIFDNQL